MPSPTVGSIHQTRIWKLNLGRDKSRPYSIAHYTSHTQKRLANKITQNERYTMICPLCSPAADIDILWQDDFCRVVLLNDADYPAYCRVELIAHIKEMTDLPPENRNRMMKIVFAVETAIREVINPDKINLASLGNKTPHLHWHVIPRFADDKHFPNSHWGEAVRDAPQPNIHALAGDAKNMLKDKIKVHIECALKAD